MIEPLGSVSAIQVESFKPKTQVQTQNAEAMEGTKLESKPQVDSTTKVVESLDEKDENSLQQQLQQQPDPESLRKAVDDMNKKMITNNSELQFGIHEGTNRVTIKVIDKETKKVIKELPPEKTLDMIAKAWELAGILVDERR